MFPKLLNDFTVIGLFKTFYSEIIIDSWEVTRSYRKIPVYTSPGFPLLVTFYVTIVQYQNQEVDNGICIVLYHFIMNVV